MKFMMVRAVIDLPRLGLAGPMVSPGRTLKGHVVDDVDVAVALERCTGGLTRAAKGLQVCLEAVSALLLDGLGSSRRGPEDSACSA